MARRTARLIETSPNLEHVNVRRNSNGVVQSTQATNNTGNNVTGTTTTTVTVTTLSGLVAFTSATLSIAGGGATNTADGNLLIDGSTVLSTSGTGAATTSRSPTHTTPLNNPQYQVQIVARGGTVTWSLAVSHNQRWA